MQSKGDKDDSEKAKIHLIPTEAILGMASALGMGAKKYGAYNFRGGIEYTRIIDSLMRHTLAFLAGEENDPESGLPHTYHIGANFAMLEYMRVHCPEMDDRYKPEKDSMLHKEALKIKEEAEELLKKKRKAYNKLMKD